MIQLFVSPSNAERLAAAREFVRSFSPATEMLLVGASRESADHLAREISSSSRATFGLHRFSITQLAARFATAEFAGRGLAHTTKLGMEAVTARAAFEVASGEGLRYFAPIADRPGFPRALARTLAELRLRGVRPASLELFGGAGADLADLLRAFERQIERASVADRAALFTAASEALKQAADSRPMPLVFIDVPVDSGAERDFLAALVVSNEPVLAVTPQGDEAALRAWDSIPGVARRQHERLSLSGTGRLSDHLFSENPPPEGAPDGAVHFFSAPGEGRECVEIARRILEEARGGIPFDRIAVLVRDPAIYATLVETAFRRAGIPAFFARGTRRPDPAGRAFLALLACGADKLSAKRFAEYLSLSQVPDPKEDGAPPDHQPMWVPPADEEMGPAIDAARVASQASAEPEPDVRPPSASEDSDSAPVVHGVLRAPRKWEQLLVEAAVVGGKDRWERRLAGLEAEWRLKVEAIRNDEPDSPRLPALERDLAHLSHLKQFALPIIAIVADLPVRAPWGEWLDRLEKLAPRVLRNPARVLGVLAELKPMAEVGPVTLDEIRDVLTPRLSTVEMEPPESPYGRVFVAAPEDMRGRAFDVVFLPGLAERVFPRQPHEDPLLLDTLREQIREQGAGELTTQNDRLQRERLLLRLAAGAATKRIYFSYPRFEIPKSRQRVPSFYALEIQRAVTGRLPNIEELERQAAQESDAGLSWPAPADPDRAIDIVERDLAVLGGLTRAVDPTALKGRARYLLELNSHLARSLRGRWARWQSGWSPYDGLCATAETTHEALAGHRLAARPYSVSALQKFAVCPYQFLLSAIHRFAPREESVPLERMDALTRGHLFHRVQADLGRRLQDSGDLPVSTSNLDRALKALDQTLDRVADLYQEKLAPAILRVWRDEVDSIRTDLRAWLRWLVEHGADAWQPVHFELGIGFPREEGRDPASLADPVTLGEGGYKLHGFVDLIERRNGEAGGGLRVTDHKTGQNRTQTGMVIDGGRTLQPVLYGLAVEAALGQPVTESRLFFCTTAGGFAERPVTLDERARASGIGVLDTIDRAVARRFLPPAPVEGACRWCDFREACGPYEEIRVARKNGQGLAELGKLRSQP